MFSICEHCLNPSCVASCPSGAMYKRLEDGIVLVDRRTSAVASGYSGCPYKRSPATSPARPRSARCYPRLEEGCQRSAPRPASADCATLAWCSTTPTRCLRQPRWRTSATCSRAARLLPRSVRSCRASRGGSRRHPHDWIVAAQQSPIWALTTTRWRCRCTRSTGRCRWSGRNRRCRRSWTSPPAPGNDGEDQVLFCGAVDDAYPAVRWPNCSPPGIPVRWRRRCAGWWRCAPHARHQPRPDVPGGRPGGRSHRAGHRGRGCWRSRPTPSAT